MRRAARVDTNQAAIVKALRKIGAVVTHTHTLGRGVADIFVSYGQQWFCLELKSKGGKLTRDEKKWCGIQRAPVYIVFSPEEAIGVVTGKAFR
jgi:hypothetical protein